MAADEPYGETLTFSKFESEAHSLVLVNIDTSSTYVGVADSGGLASGMKNHQGRRRRKNNTRSPGASRGFLNPALAVGTTVSGSIEAKTDSAYMISMIVAGEKLTGVLYHVSPNHEVKQFARVTAPLLELHAADIKSKNAAGSLRKRRRKLLSKDRDEPKKNRTGYNFFFAEERLRLKEAYPNMRSERQITRTVAEAWNGLSQKQREPYQELGVRDVERYRVEKREYGHQRLCKVNSLGGDTDAEGSVAHDHEEDRSTRFTLVNERLPWQLKVHEIHGEMPTDEHRSSDIRLPLEKLSPLAESSMAGA